MARSIGRRFGRDDAYYWPGFVDAMAQLLLVITFLMSVFMITQFLLSREISGRDTVLTRLKAQIAELTQLLAMEKSTKTELETSLAALTDDLQTARSDKSKLQSLVDSFTLKENTDSSALTGLRGQLDSERKISSEAMARIELLNQQIAALRRQIAALNEALQAAEGRDQEFEDADRRSRAAAQCGAGAARPGACPLPFGILRKAAPDPVAALGHPGGGRPFRVPVGGAVPQGLGGDQSGGPARARQAGLGDEGARDQGIPPDLAWVLRVDGHTDTDPIQTSAFSSNWELSAARAIAVVKELIARGVAQPAGRGRVRRIPADRAGDSEEIKTRTGASSSSSPSAEPGGQAA